MRQLSKTKTLSEKANHLILPSVMVLALALALGTFFYGDEVESQGKRGLLKYAFTDPVVETSLYYQPITSLAGVREANERVFIRREGFENSYKDLQVISAEQVERTDDAHPVVRVRFQYQSRDYEAFAYGKLPTDVSVKRASLIIPGSGLNQSLGIVEKDPKNYHHGILNALDAGGDIFTLIKPNEDFLAWHDGMGKKLRGEAIWNWHLNRGGSYSVSYVVQSLAFMKWMNSCYSETIVAGLSQGGAAALSNAIQSKPILAIVASGASILFDEMELSGSNQLTGFFDFARFSKPSSLVAALQSSPTVFLFSWGSAETDYYKLEAEQRITAKFIEPLTNVKVAIHDGGHVYPVEEIKAFLASHLLLQSDQLKGIGP